MEEYRLFQEKQKSRKQELERLISKEKAELELKHKQERADLAVKHNQLRNELNKELVEERQQRPRSSKNKYVSKKRLFEDDIDTSEHQTNKKIKSAFDEDNFQKEMRQIIKAKSNKKKVNDHQSILTRIGLLTSSDSEEDDRKQLNNQSSKKNNECTQLMMTSILETNVQDNQLQNKDNSNVKNIINIHTQEANLSTNVHILNNNNSQEVYIEDNQLDISDPLGELYENEYPLTQVEKLSNEINTNDPTTSKMSNEKPNEGFFSWLKK